MIASWKNCFEEELLCPICLNVFEEPVQLPCKHNFCRNCICGAWAKDSSAVRCPECNHDYDPKPALEKNFKLANIVKRFNALNTEKVPAVLHCVLCRRGPPLPVRKVCLRCKEPCCQSHVHTHLQQPCAAPGHLFVDPEELSAWTCPTHEEYRLLHCEEEQVALCPFCCMSHCTTQRHTVSDVDTRRIQMQALLMKQQDKLEHRVQSIDEHLTKLNSDKTLIKGAVCQLKERVQGQYQRMQALLEMKQTETMQMLECSYSSYLRKNSQQAVQLNDNRHSAERLLHSLQSLIHSTRSINFMKNTKSYHLVVNRSNSHLSCGIPLLRVGQLRCHQFLSELIAREKKLQNVLDEPVSEESILELVSHTNLINMRTLSSGSHKRKYGMAFSDDNMEHTTSEDRSALRFRCKKALFSDQTPMASAPYPYGQQSPHIGPSQRQDRSSHHLGALGPGCSHHSGTVFPHYFPSGGASQPAVLEGRKVLMCTLHNCCCSQSPRTGPLSEHFPPLPPQDFSPHTPFPMSSMMDMQQSNRHTDFFGLYGQSSSKHYLNT